MPSPVGSDDGGEAPRVDFDRSPILSRRDSLRHESVKFVRADLSVPIRIGPLDHLQEFGIAHRLSEIGRDPPQILEGDVSRPVVVEEPKDPVDVRAVVRIAQVRRHHVQEFVKGQGVRGVDPVDQTVEGPMLRVRSQIRHAFPQLVDVDGPQTLRIEDVEGLPNLRDLDVVQTRRTASSPTHPIRSFPMGQASSPSPTASPPSPAPLPPPTSTDASSVAMTYVIFFVVVDVVVVVFVERRQQYRIGCVGMGRGFGRAGRGGTTLGVLAIFTLIVCY